MENKILNVKFQYERMTPIELDQEIQGSSTVYWNSIESLELNRQEGSILYIRKPFEKVSYRSELEDKEGVEEFFKSFEKANLFEKRMEEKYVPEIKEGEEKNITITVKYEDREKVIENNFQEKSLPNDYFHFLVLFKEFMTKYENLDIFNNFYYEFDKNKKDYINLLEIINEEDPIYVATDELSIKSGDRVLLTTESDENLVEGTYISMKVGRQIFSTQAEVEDIDFYFDFVDKDIFSDIDPADDQAYYVSLI